MSICKRAVAGFVISLIVFGNMPLLLGSHVTSLEFGHYYVGWTPYGWAFQIDWRKGSKGRTWRGFWPWYDPDYWYQRGRWEARLRPPSS